MSFMLFLPVNPVGELWEILRDWFPIGIVGRTQQTYSLAGPGCCSF